MKTLLTLSVLLFSTSVVAETYSCSQELSRYNRAGEIETTIYSRNGNIFRNEIGWEFLIAKETEDILILISTKHWEKSIFATVIDKKTKEFTDEFVDIKDARDNESLILVYGKCTIFN